MNGLALCAGVGGFEQGIERVFDRCRTVCYVEGEAYSASILAKQMEQGRIHQAPIWSNVRSFDGRPWREIVDFISAGFPCQPFSKAGKQKGTEDERHLWPQIVRIIGEIEPSIIFLENVPNVIDFAGEAIASDLAEMGYRFGWGIVRASDAKAPHRRARWFCVAVHPDADVHGFFISRKDSNSSDPIELQEGREPSPVRSAISDTNGFNDAVRRDSQAYEKKMAGRDGEFRGSKCDSKEGCEEGARQYPGNVSDTNGNSESSMRIYEIKGGIFRQPSQWEIEPKLDRMADGMADWVDRLRACGNGVVPHQAELAIRIILEMLFQHSKP